MPELRLTRVECQAVADRTLASLDSLDGSEALRRFGRHEDAVLTDELTGKPYRRFTSAVQAGGGVLLSVGISAEPYAVRRARRFKLASELIEGWRGAADGAASTWLPLARADTTIRLWEARDREAVQSLLRLLSEDAVVRGQEAGTYVAEDGEEVVGMVTLCVFVTLTGPKAYLDHLVVAPGWRRRGVGRMLVRRAIEQARAAGAARIDLTAGDGKRAGRALYRSLGFEERDTASFRLPL